MENIKRLIDQLFRVDQFVKHTKESPQERYSRIVINMDDPRYIGDNIEIRIAGDYINKVLYSGSPDVYIRINHRHSGKIYLTEFRRLWSPYNKIFLTNPTSQPGKKLILITGSVVVGEIEPSTGAKTAIVDNVGSDINPAKEDGNLQLINDRLRVQNRSGRLRVTEEFAGIPYLKSITTTDTATPFEILTTKLRSVVINNTHDTFSTLVGTHDSQIFEIRGGSTLSLDDVDMNLLYYRSKVIGSHPSLNIIGTYKTIVHERIPSDVLRHSNDPLKTTSSTVFERLKAIRFNEPIRGGIRVYYFLIPKREGTEVITELRRNGVSLGITKTATASTAATHDLTNINWNANDELEIWGRTTNAAIWCMISHFRVSYDIPEQPTTPTTNILE